MTGCRQILLYPFNTKRFLSIIFFFLLFTFFWQTRYVFSPRSEIIDYLIPFVYLSDALMAIVLIGILFFYRRKFWAFVSLYLSKTTFLFLIFLLTAFISNLQAKYMVGAWYKFVKLFGWGLFAFGLAWFINFHKPKVLSSIFKCLSLGLVLEALIAWGEFLTGSSLGLQVLGEWRFSVLTPGIAKVVWNGQELLRPYATFPHPNVLGGVLAIFAVMNLHFFGGNIVGREVIDAKENLSGFSPLTRLVKEVAALGQLFAFFLFSATLLITFSRSAWMAFVIMLVADLIFWAWQLRRLLSFKVISVVIIFLLFTFYFLLFIPNPIRQRFENLASSDVPSVTRRVELVEASLEMIQDNLFWGVGLNNFVPNLERYTVVSGQGRWLQPVHNVPLLILAETGLIGFSALTIFVGFLILELTRVIINTKKTFIFNLSFLILIMWLGIFSTSFFDHYWWSLQAGQVMFWLTVGLTLAVISKPDAGIKRRNF